MANKKQPALREVKFDEQSQQMAYVRSARAKLMHPYQGARISDVQTFNDYVIRNEKDLRTEDQIYEDLEQKLRAEIIAKGIHLKADAYEIVADERNQEDFSDDEFEDSEPKYFLFTAAIFYRQN